MSLIRSSLLALVLAACRDAGETESSPGGEVDHPVEDPPSPTPCDLPKPSYASGVAGGVGAWTTLYVTNADPSKNEVSVLFVGAPGIIKGYDAGEQALTIVIPPDAQSGPLTLRVGCAEYIGPAPFHLDPVPAPVVAAVSSATLTRTESVDVTGQYFTSVNAVSVAGERVDYTVIDDATLRLAANGPARSGKLVVVSTSGAVFSEVLLTIGP